MRKTLLFLAVMLFTAFSLTAQTARPISGVVTDDKGEPVPFASILIKGSKTGVAANESGAFKINAKTGDVLVISGVGFATKEVTVAASNTLTIQIVRDASTTEVVVVTTQLGEKRQAKELGYSTAKVNSKELTQAKVVNLQNGLTGKVSGLNVTTVNNGVFADTRITLRGIRSLTGNNQPLLVVDGVPISLGFINSINPNDIADVTILKSASATALYGGDGVNGAIVITTKKGSKTKPQISFSSTVQLETIAFMPKFQTQFGSGSSEDANGYGIYDPVENQCYGPAFDGSMVQIGRDNTITGEKFMTTYSPRPNEKRKFFNTGITLQNDFSFSTGDFYLSVQDVDIKGTVPKDKNHRTSLRVSANKEYNRFKANFNVTYTQTNFNVTTGDVYWKVFNTPMHIPLTQFKDWQDPASWGHPNNYFSDYYSNPYFDIDNQRQTGRRQDIIANVEFSYKLTDWLTANYRLGTTLSSSNDQSIVRAFNYSAAAKGSGKYIAGVGDINASASSSNASSSRVVGEFFLNFRKNINKDFRVDALVGHLFRETQATSTAVSSSVLGVPTVFNTVGRRGEPGASESFAKTRLQRFYAKASLSYQNWLFAEVSGNMEDNSLLDLDGGFNRKIINYTYPSFNLSAVVSDAIPALKNSKTISFLKVRGSLAKTANTNAIGAYSLVNIFNPSTDFPFGNLLGFTASNVLRPLTLQPEFVNTKEVGMEVGFMKNKINFEVTYYEQDNSNQILTAQSSIASGFTGALVNGGSFVNKGIEFDLKLTPLVKIKKFSADVKINYSYQTNKVYQVLDGIDEIGIGNGNYILKGMPAFTFKLTDYVRDDQGRVVVDASTGLPSLDPNLRTFGQTIPSHLLGLSTSLNYDRFTLNIVADYRGGAQVYHGIGPDMDFTGISYRSGQNARQRFVFPNSSYWDGSKYVANTSIYTNSGGYGFWEQAAYNRSINSNYLTSADFWKIREIALSYNIPVSIFGRNNNVVKGATFTITGRNLFAFLPSSNQWTDPEFSGTTGNAQGVNSSFNTPPTRIWGANLTLNF